MKTCTSCKLEKPFEDFRRQSKTKDGYKYRCKECDNSAAREYYQRKKKKDNNEKKNNFLTCL